MYRLVLFAICLMLVFCCACAPSGKTALEAASLTLSVSPTSTPTATPEPTITASPSIAPTATASPKPTIKIIDSTPMIVKGKELFEVNVNQRFQDFLNGTGAFTDEKIRNMSLSSPFNEKEVLGCIGAGSQGYPYFLQGVMLYYKKIDEGEVIAFGTKNRKGKKIITLIEYPSTVLLQNGLSLYIPIYLEKTPGEGVVKIADREYFQRSTYYYKFIDLFIGRPILLNMHAFEVSDDPNYDNYKDNIKKAFLEIDKKVQVNRIFLTNVYYPDDAHNDVYRNMDDFAKELYDAKVNEIITIKTLEEFENQISTNYSQIPNCTVIYFTSFD